MTLTPTPPLRPLSTLLSPYLCLYLCLLRSSTSYSSSLASPLLQHSLKPQRPMGTLTADCPRLDTHCDHKLATSCRLTSTPHCCACADERPHSRTYRVYIDGVGFVQRGTRWQGYCERATWARFIAEKMLITIRLVLQRYKSSHCAMIRLATYK
jgi:hypothetical protein